MPTQENINIADRLIQEIWNKGDVAVVDELYASNFGNFHPPPDFDSEPRKIKEFVIKKIVSACRTAFPDLHFTIESQSGEGDIIVINWIARGTHQGDLQGISPTGKQFVVTGRFILQIASGRIVEHLIDFDQLALLQQLGIVPLPEQARRGYTLHLPW